MSEKIKPDEDMINPPLTHPRRTILKLFWKNYSEILKKYIPVDKQLIVADFGCGNKPYKAHIEPYVKKYIGIDIPGNTSADVFIELETNKTEIEDESCDIILSTQVLEHVSNYDSYLNECYRILKPNGILILSTHGQWIYHPDPTDYWRWTCDGLSSTITKHHFQIKKQWGVMGLLPTSIQFFQDACVRLFPIPKFLHPVFYLFMQTFVLLSEKLISVSKTARGYTNKDACLYFIIATKNDLPL